METKPDRRWFRYTLRALFVFVTIACVGFGWFSWKLRQAKKQRDAWMMVATKGGFVVYEYQRTPNGWDPNAQSPSPEWLRKRFGEDLCCNVVGVVLKSVNITEGELATLEGLPHLEELELVDTNINDEGMVHIKALKHLKSLNLSYTKVTDAGIAQLRDLTSLQSLGLRETEVSDAGLKELQELNELRELDVANTAVTDEGYRALRNVLPKLADW